MSTKATNDDTGPISWIKKHSNALKLCLLYSALILAGIIAGILIYHSYCSALDHQLTEWTLSSNDKNGETHAWAKLGTIGDSYGKLNCVFTGFGAIVSALAFIAFLHTLHMQREELIIQRNEMKESREEVERQTQQFKKQVNISAMQALYATVPTYEKQMNARWSDMVHNLSPQQRQAWKESSISALRCTEEVLVASFGGDEPDLSIKSMMQAISVLYDAISPYFPWSYHFFQWSAKVERLLNQENENKQEIIDAKRMLLAHMRPEELCILWFCYLACRDTSEPPTPDFLSFWELKQYTNLYDKVHFSNLDFKEIALRLISKRLNALYMANAHAEVGDFESAHEYDNDSEEEIKKEIKIFYNPTPFCIEP